VYDSKVTGAIPENEDEYYLFERAMAEKDRELIAEAVVEMLDGQKRRAGAPRKTAGDKDLAKELLEKHSGNIKLARQEFIKSVATRDQIDKKRARERFNDARKT
jgi:hypothetical protein